MLPCCCKLGLMHCLVCLLVQASQRLDSADWPGRCVGRGVAKRDGVAVCMAEKAAGMSLCASGVSGWFSGLFSIHRARVFWLLLAHLLPLDSGCRNWSRGRLHRSAVPNALLSTAPARRNVLSPGERTCCHLGVLALLLSASNRHTRGWRDGHV